jgi:hypothetical protein
MLLQVQRLATVRARVGVELRLIQIVPAGPAVDLYGVRRLDQSKVRGPWFKGNFH